MPHQYFNHDLKDIIHENYDDHHHLNPDHNDCLDIYGMRASSAEVAGNWFAVEAARDLL